MVETGKKAPKFKMPTDTGETVTLDSFKGRKLVLYFYPKDDTSGCTKEAIAFSELLPAFEEAGIAVLGVSKDTVQKHAKFREKHELTVPLASDEEGETVEAYGVWVEKSMYGKTYMGIERATFLIDEKGIVREIWHKVKVPGHAEVVLEAATALG
ncbi:thioredoxin-dependent thiol peroxidase [Parvularcula sp. LCG005]|uniref:thioredoxin-dependent thiol peroxidase n=1 Tax=Parvularcula sp. LCG005 TaxID=3078805 RepID=UPI002942C861|nr:thioredoxin-dependent thiol peroxidase [Parvularcula sp. LCG005]WOI54111.1 thioredoxin-dependent thiol peroxidase [Parvularcula sp. LCG005]